MAEILAELTKHPVKTRLSLTGPLVVARDIAHAKIKERLDAGEEMPDYLRDHPVYYAGPAKTPEGMASGSFGPTTAGRMDSYVSQFQAAGGSMVMLAKGNRSKQVTERATSTAASTSARSAARRPVGAGLHQVQEVHRIPRTRHGGVWKIEVEDFPAFIVVDDKGNDFFTDPSGAVTVRADHGTVPSRNHPISASSISTTVTCSTRGSASTASSVKPSPSPPITTSRGSAIAARASAARATSVEVSAVSITKIPLARSSSTAGPLRTLRCRRTTSPRGDSARAISVKSTSVRLAIPL
jgi:tartrate/fumarate subfamily iron-sulfur-dependent hydro-lyase beta chain